MRYAVLGAGALGLTAAYRLTQQQQEVLVFEKEPLPGGLASGFTIGDVWLEKFYHHIFQTDMHIIRLLAELGLKKQLVWVRPKTASLIGATTYQLDSALSLLQFRPLTLQERLRVGAVLAYLKYAPSDWLENKVATTWTRKWMGDRAFSLLFETLFTSKFSQEQNMIALPWFGARIRDRTKKLGYVQGGFQQLYNRLTEEIQKDERGKVFYNTSVQNITPDTSGGWNIHAEKTSWHVDRILSTLPTRITCTLFPDLPATYKEQYNWGKAYGAHCLILSLTHPLTDCYWLNICDDGYPFTGVFEHTNLISSAFYENRHIVYLGNYKPMNDSLFSMKKEEIIALYIPGLQKIQPDFQAEWIQDSWAFQAPYAQPIVTTDYKTHIPPFHTPLPDLWLANMFQIYPHDRGQNYSIQLANTVVEVMM